MKNYSISSAKSKEFILNYKVVGNQIIINYADGNVKMRDYSIQAEKEILEKMRMQVLMSRSFSANLNNKFEIFLKLFLDEVLLFVLFGIGAINLNLSLTGIIMGSIIFPIVIGYTGYKLRGYQKIRNDIKKNLLFINNEDRLNPIIRQKSHVTKRLRDELRKKICCGNTNTLPFSLNSIDRLSYRELKEIYNSVNMATTSSPDKNVKKRKRLFK